MKLENGMVVHCDTNDKAYLFLEKCHKQGLKWNDGKSIINCNNRIDSRYFFYESDTVYYIKEDGLYYGSLRKISITKLISYDDLLKLEEKKQCKIYEKPEYINDNVKKVIVNEPCVIVFLDSGEKGTAKCCPEDKFNERLGYEIAY